MTVDLTIPWLPWAYQETFWEWENKCLFKMHCFCWSEDYCKKTFVTENHTWLLFSRLSALSKERARNEGGAKILEKGHIHQPVTGEVSSPRLKWLMFTCCLKPSLISWELRRKSTLWKPGLEDSCLSDTLGLLLSHFFLGLQTHIIENSLGRSLLGLWFHSKKLINDGLVHL